MAANAKRKRGAQPDFEKDLRPSECMEPGGASRGVRVARHLCGPRQEARPLDGVYHEVPAVAWQEEGQDFDSSTYQHTFKCASLQASFLDVRPELCQDD